MAIFGETFYRDLSHPDEAGYKAALLSALGGLTDGQKEELLRGEIVAILGTFTRDLRWLINTNRNVHRIVFEEGLALQTWTLYLDKLATDSWEHIEMKMTEMRYDMRLGRVHGLPGSMFLKGKMSLAELDPFCQKVFDARREAGLG
jgi:hypothetical protein